MIPRYAIDSDEVRAACKLYEEKMLIARRITPPGTGGSCGLGFYDIYSRLEAGESFVEIGRAAGISRQAVSAKYETHFVTLFEAKSGNQRRVLRTRAIHDEQRAALETSVPDKPVLQLLKAAAEQAGHTVKLVVREYEGHGKPEHLRRALIIDGQVETVHCIQKPFRPNPASACEYGHTSVTHRLIDEETGLLFFINIPGRSRRVFRIPLSVIQEELFGSSTSGMQWVYIPLHETVARSRTPRIDFSQFEQPWVFPVWPEQHVPV